MTAASYGWLVLAFPIVGLLVIALGWRVWRGNAAGWIASVAILASFVASILMLIKLQDLPSEARHITDSAFTYFEIGNFKIDLSIFVDPLSVFMCLVVSGVSFLIHLYSISYMKGDTGFNRYFAYLNYFVFSMLLLVLAGNFVLLIIGWAFVGAASYLLISFWYRRHTATSAGMKAFVINVIGDIGLVIAAFLIFNKLGTLDYMNVFETADEVFSVNDGVLIAACLMLLVGAFAKSAQLPLHTWLPDAMEGPTPVSSLIHAATMVTAGVYLIARTHPLFELAPTAMDISAVIGCATLVFAATIAIVQTDIKRAIAYSTMSQIGYMIMGVSAAAYGAGLFHLMTHAFFKALLFMGAGSVIGAMAGIQDMNKMGGFKKAMPFTFITFVCGALALAGFPLTSGFFSKDEILSYTINRGGGFVVLGVLGYIAAFMTAFYAFRIVFRTFYGDAVPEAKELEHGQIAHGPHVNPANGEEEDTDVGFPGPSHQVAEREFPMKIAMGTLAFLALTAGVLGIPGVTDVIDKFLEPTFEDSRYIHDHPSLGMEYALMACGAIIAISGIYLAFYVYRRRPGTAARAQARFAGLHKVLWHKYYFDEVYDAVFVRPMATAGKIGRTVIETEFVQGVIVGGAVGIVRVGTSFARGIQTGLLRAYALLLIFGVAALALYFLIQSS